MTILCEAYRLAAEYETQQKLEEALHILRVAHAAMKYKKRCDKSRPKWHLDLFSTILSRKHSLHKRVGKLQYVKTIKQ